MSYEARILKKANFYLNKHRLHHKKYPNYTTYTKWINQGKFTDFPFRINEVIIKGLTSNLVGGNRVPQITMSKKRRRANLAGVIAIKDVLVKLLGKEPQVDQIGILIALYALEHLKNSQFITPNKLTKQPFHKKETPKETSKESPNEPTNEPTNEPPSLPPKITIEMPEIKDDDDWEALC